LRGLIFRAGASVVSGTAGFAVPLAFSSAFFFFRIDLGVEAGVDSATAVFFDFLLGRSGVATAAAEIANFL
jgi:hypothetical protein